jgi:glycosyltransferase involved in cell wall biosynthesis
MSARCLWESRAQSRLQSLAGQAAHPHPWSVTAFFPAYNDAATIGTLVEYTDRALSLVASDYEILVVNDGSLDATAEVLRRAQEKCPRLRVVTNDRNRGYGAALRAGFRSASKDFVFYTDGDGQYDPTEILSLLPHAPAMDWVNGFKIQRGDGIYRDLLGRAYRTLASFLFGLRIRDVDCDFRLIRRSILDSIPLTSTSGSICAEMVFQLQCAGARLVEVPVMHYPRVAGRSQFLSLRRVVRSLTYLAQLWWGLRFRPWAQQRMWAVTPSARRERRA